MVDRLSRARRSWNMSRVRSVNTGPELMLRRAARAAGLRGYRLHVTSVPGRPDLAFTRQRLAVFVDGAFWHGHPSAFRRGKSGSFWDQKISANIERDRLSERRLIASGWRYIRFWDFEVESDPHGCVRRVLDVLREPRSDSPDAI